MSAPTSTRRWAPADSFLVVLLLVAGAAIGAAAILLRPDLTRGAGFLFADEGFSLYVAEQLIQGRRLYVDVAYMYGPVPPFLHAAWALIVGNTPSSYLTFHLVVSLCNVGLSYLLVRRWTSTTTAAIVGFAGLLPVLVVPGAILGGYVSSPYQPLERSLILTAALLWRPPGERPVTRSAALGALLGSFHLVRFGAGPFMLLSVLLLDAAILFAGGGRAWRDWIRTAAALMAGFAGAELAIVTVLFLWLPAPVAGDVAWPAYMLRAFDEVLPQRWPRWEGWRVLVGQYLTVVSAVALTAAAMAVSARRERASNAGAAALFLPAVLFVFGCLWFFRSVHHFRQFAWMLVIPAAWAIERHRVLRPVAIVLWAPVLAVAVRSAVNTPPQEFQVVALPSGGSVALSREWRGRVDALVHLLGRSSASPAVIFPNGSGFHATFDVPAAGRHVFFFAGAVQEDEIEQTIAQVDRARTLVVCEPGAPDVADPARSPALFPPYFPRDAARALQSRILDRVWSDGRCGVFRLRDARASRSPRVIK